MFEFNFRKTFYVSPITMMIMLIGLMSVAVNADGCLCFDDSGCGGGGGGNDDGGCCGGGGDYAGEVATLVRDTNPKPRKVISQRKKKWNKGDWVRIIIKNYAKINVTDRQNHAHGKMVTLVEQKKSMCNGHVMGLTHFWVVKFHDPNTDNKYETLAQRTFHEHHLKKLPETKWKKDMMAEIRIEDDKGDYLETGHGNGKIVTLVEKQRNGEWKVKFNDGTDKGFFSEQLMFSPKKFLKLTKKQEAKEKRLVKEREKLKGLCVFIDPKTDAELKMHRLDQKEHKVTVSKFDSSSSDLGESTPKGSESSINPKTDRLDRRERHQPKPRLHNNNIIPTFDSEEPNFDEELEVKEAFIEFIKEQAHELFRTARNCGKFIDAFQNTLGYIELFEKVHFNNTLKRIAQDKGMKDTIEALQMKLDKKSVVMEDHITANYHKAKWDQTLDRMVREIVGMISLNNRHIKNLTRH